MLNKLIVAAAFATATLMSAPAFASTTVGSLDNANCYPFQCNDSGSNVGQSFDYYEIYNGSAFSGPTSFSQISFQANPNFSQGPGVLNGSYNISFATTTAALGSGFPVAPLANVATFFNGALGGNYAGVFAINGTNYNYDPSNGNLVMHVVVNNQDNVANGTGNGYMWADYTGSSVSRAYDNTHGNAAGVGALVTTFGSGTPEPAAWALMLIGFGGIGAMLRHRRNVAFA